MVEQEIIYNLNTLFAFRGEGEEGSELEAKNVGRGKRMTPLTPVLFTTKRTNNERQKLCLS